MNNTFNRFFRIAIAIVSFAVPPLISASATVPPDTDKWVGTWILNIQKSQYGDEKPPVDPALIRQILKIRVSNGTMDLYFRTEMVDGTDLADETHLVDLTGKPHVTEIDGLKQVTETFRQLDRNTIEITLKARPTEPSDVADGELTIKVNLAMSADGNTIHEVKEYHYKEFADTGKAAASDDRNPAEGSILVFDRQQPNR
ncbi:MAG TPA: hypothetical protein VGK48_22565 [Terriglobia bacterium]|jgi:hypothetical protein